MLIIVRGLPGSGKSTHAKHNLIRIQDWDKTVHLETDMYFIKNGVYQFDGNLIKKAHEWCYKTTEVFLNQKYNVVVSNTFTQKWEFDKYLTLAEELGIPYKVIRMTGNYGNIHDVPEDILKRMADRFEDFPNEELVI